VSALVSETDLVKRARDAQGRDWPAATEAAFELRQRFPDNRAGYEIGAAAARMQWRLEEASALAAEAAKRFPGQPWLMVEQASIALARGDANHARALAQELRGRFPEDAAGYRIGAAAARSAMLLDEAEAIAQSAIARFPNADWPLSLPALNESARGRTDEAIRLAEELRVRYPEADSGYYFGAMWLRSRNRLDEAEAMLRAAPPALSSRAWFAQRASELASLQANRAHAAALIEALAGGNGERQPSAPDRAGGLDRVAAVVGMHRAGTSLCAKIVDRLGFPLGGPLLQSGFDNLDGYYEHSEINARHEALLACLGAGWDTVWSVRAPPDKDMQSAEAGAIVERLKGIVAEQLRACGGRWAFKDPRVAAFLPLWKKLFAELEAAPIWILAVRDPRAVAASLHSRNRLPLELGELLWVEHYLNALRWLGPEISAVVHYEKWFRRPDEQLARLGRALDADSDGAHDAAARCVVEELRHNDPGPGEPILEIARTVYSWLTAEDIDLHRIQRKAQEHWRALESTWAGLQARFPGDRPEGPRES
jgi:tetratricopeptide (TPR) repeat protein